MFPETSVAYIMNNDFVLIQFYTVVTLIYRRGNLGAIFLKQYRNITRHLQTLESSFADSIRSSANRLIVIFEDLLGGKV